jgi:DNA-binding response OmpR family regulator
MHRSIRRVRTCEECTMKILLMDESTKRRDMIADALEKSKHSVVVCRNANEFMEAVSGGLPEKILLDVDTWNSGKALYHYFGVSRSLETVPVVFYNAPEDFSGIPDRSRHASDRILGRPTDVETAVSAAAD